jgi:Carboxypeptidase regulatory-like domain
MYKRGGSPTFGLLTASLSILLLAAPALQAQSTQGTISITVTDPAGAVVPSAALQLKAIETNDLRTASSQGAGTYRFVGLNIGNYELTVIKPGFAKAVISPIVVQAARVTDVAVQLKLSSTATSVEVVTGAAPVLETSSNMIGTTINVKQIEDLPLGGRDLTQLSHLTAGYNGTWNGLPATAEGNNIDGVISSASRMKFTGNSNPSISPRIENVEEMTVQTDELDVDQGFGAAAMQLNFITRAGTNEYHGRVYEDFRNKDLNANTWSNNGRGIPLGPYILNNFGASVGGPILKNKLFFFGSFSMSKQPGSFTASNAVLTSAAQQGNYTYVGSDGVNHTVNVLDLMRAYNPALPNTINPIIAAEQAAVNGSLSGAAVTASNDPIANNVNWLVASPETQYYPAIRIDYSQTDNVRWHFTYNQTKTEEPTSGAPPFPGGDFADRSYGYLANNKTFALGNDWIITPTIINQFTAGFLYNPVWNPWYQGPPSWTTAVGVVAWDLPFGGDLSGTNYTLPISNYYPNITLSDSVAWQHGSHQFKFGFSGFQEHDRYWNAPAGITTYDMGLANGDPALGAFDAGAFPSANLDQIGEAEQLYAVLTGRISDVYGQYGLNPKTKQYDQTPGSTYNLNELLRSWGLFAQDSWHVSPNLTVNLGLRWDFTGDNYDLSGAYHNATPADIYGPSGVGNLFNPGVLNGIMNPVITANPHAYHGWDISPQPEGGIAWKPDWKSGILGKLSGHGDSVVRAGFSLRRFTEPQQYFWNQATDYGALYFQQYYLYANNSGTAGSFAPGSLNLGDPLPPLGYSPHATYEVTAPLAEYTFTPLTYFGNVVNGMNPHIAQPYTMSWNFGIQRELGQSRVLEIRYNGNVTRNQWLSENVNEVNVVENGFLNQFKIAQGNLAINKQHGVNSFADNGYAGQQATPIFNAAFAGEAAGGNGVPFIDYANTSFINDLNTGQVGRLANVLAGISGPVPYFCNLVGSSFTPCVTNAGYTGPGAGYPINFFQANPYSAGAAIQYMDSKGYSNYNALQIELRQRSWHGVEFDANYTWSHTLGISTPNDWTAASTQYTLRDLRLSYGPTLYDLRHVVHAYGTYDLPFGHGRQFLNHGGMLDRIVGGWTIGDIFTFQSGAPKLVTSGYETFNDYGDGGVILNGITAQDLQNSIGVHYVGSARGGYVDLLDPKYMVSPTGGGANKAYILPNENAGTFGQSFYLYGPHEWFDDASISKAIPITERIRFSLQGEFLNIFNHPNFTWGTTAILSSSFGTGAYTGTPRQIELRANLVF